MMMHVCVKEKRKKKEREREMCVDYACVNGAIHNNYEKNNTKTRELMKELE